MCEGFGVVVNNESGARVLRFDQDRPGFVYLSISFTITTQAASGSVFFLLVRDGAQIPLNGALKDVFPTGFGTAQIYFPADRGDYRVFMVDGANIAVPFQYTSFSEVFVRTSRVYS